MRILLVEDDKGQAYLVTRNLRRIFEEVIVDSAENLQDARLKLRSTLYDLLLLDLKIPYSQKNRATTNKLEALLVLHLENNKVPILVLTGAFNGDLTEQAISEGASGYVKKQMASNPDTLDIAIKGAIANHRRLELEQLHSLVEERALQLQRAQIENVPSLISSCSVCHKWRTLQGEWLLPEVYLKGLGIDFTHGYCQEHKRETLDQVFRSIEGS